MAREPPSLSNGVIIRSIGWISTNSAPTPRVLARLGWSTDERPQCRNEHDDRKDDDARETDLELSVLPIDATALADPLHVRTNRLRCGRAVIGSKLRNERLTLMLVDDATSQLTRRAQHVIIAEDARPQLATRREPDSTLPANVRDEVERRRVWWQKLTQDL